jgi:mono/diheme cytochrome c family protein
MSDRVNQRSTQQRSDWLRFIWLTQRSIYSWAIVALMVIASPNAHAVDERRDTQEFFRRTLQPLIAERCLQCHGEGGQGEGDVDLSRVNSVDDLFGQPELIQQLIHVIDAGYMPPEEEPQLSLPLRTSVVRELKQALAVAVAAAEPRVAAPIRRMTRLQYNNAVQDLFQLKVEVFPLRERMMRDLSGYFRPDTGKMPQQVKVACRPLSKFQVVERHLSLATPFPQDLRAEHGFDNRADHLSMSPVLMEAFVRLSRAVVESPEMNARQCGIWQAFFAPPDQMQLPAVEADIKTRLRGFLTRAFRRPVEEAALDLYTQHVVTQLQNDVAFTDAMKSAAAAAIASPRFLYLYDISDPESQSQFDDYNLASRLSFFLWGSIPDDELLQLAADQQLRKPDVLQQQTERMLRDQRLKRFCDSFPSQWLQLERIISSEPDPEYYPQFYFAKYRASMHMVLEPLLLFETVLIENRSVLDFIDSDFSYRTDLLQSWYRDGSQGKAGPPTQLTFRRVPVTDPRQGGVITSAATLTMTSGPRQTKPMTRGAWLATVILNDPPPPPPADVPPLTEEPDSDDAAMTLRERFAQHRQHASCAGCHQRIDPLGFALENFDAAGIWRDTYSNGRTIDASGTLFDSHTFNDVVQFKQVLLAERERFVRGFAAHLLSYATGRAIQASDAPELDSIVRLAAADGYQMHALIQHVVQSASFRR